MITECGLITQVHRSSTLFRNSKFVACQPVQTVHNRVDPVLPLCLLHIKMYHLF